MSSPPLPDPAPKPESGLPRKPIPKYKFIEIALMDPQIQELLMKSITMRLMRLNVHDPSTRDDCWQQVCERALTIADSYDATRGNVQVWLQGLVMNITREVCRKAKKFRQESQYAAPSAELVEQRAAELVREAEQALEEQRAKIEVLSAQLTAEEQTLLQMMRTDMSNQAMAARLGIKHPAVRQRIRRLKLKLQAMVSNSGGRA